MMGSCIMRKRTVLLMPDTFSILGWSLKKVLQVGIEPTTFCLLDRCSNQLSYQGLM
jgi:hypothetical protein